MYTLQTLWLQKTRINFLKSKTHSLAETEKAHTTPLPTYTIRLGVKHGLSISAVAHEAVHTATWIMEDYDYKCWSPWWDGINFQEEEARCYAVETIVQQVIARAQQLEIPLINPLRQNIQCLTK